ncbi:MAG TPA: hypothetical protein VND97_01000 [Beijerinckiaceae bacterium]|nr:hypothetical protein [Beijerinckiaceae bacterium]
MQTAGKGFESVASRSHDGLLSRLCKATPAEALELALSLSGRDRAELALFCNARSHLRDKGRAIASVCAWSDLSKAGGPVAADTLLHQLGQPSSSDVGAVAHRRPAVTLAGNASHYANV